MAIYSLNLRSIGRTTHAAGTASSHVRYITRPDAVSRIMGDHMPTDRMGASSWVYGQEQADRANARVVDKIMVALPRELPADQRAQLVESFCRDMTGGKCPWLAAIHDRGDDAQNPHAHIIVRDRDIETGQRVMRMSDSVRDRTKAGLEPKACEWVRERWETHANSALERAGCDERIDRRTLEVQRIDREPQIHVGPGALAMEWRGERPESKEQYKEIDAGRTRPERNAEVIDLAKEREQRDAAERAKQDEANRKADAEKSAIDAARAERAAKDAREVELYRQALAQQTAREITLQAERQAQEREMLTRQQWQRAATEQREDAMRHQTAISRFADAEKAAQRDEGAGGVKGWLLDKLAPGRAEERQRAEQERKEHFERERQAERERTQRERDDRNRAEQQELARRQEAAREALRQSLAERERTSVAALMERQAERDKGLDKALADLARQKSISREDRSRDMERERPGRDFGR
jgi:hypothetical protein